MPVVLKPCTHFESVGSLASSYALRVGALIGVVMYHIQVACLYDIIIVSYKLVGNWPHGYSIMKF